MTLAVATSWPQQIGRGAREAALMFWETLWPLVLGFGLSGAVQAFVSKERMEATLGNHRPAAVLRASGYGMVSSSCSYAATAMARSLFRKGADFVTAMIFMFASTNLVVELGIVVVVLMGWQFAAAEFVGGALMVVLLAGLGTVVLSRRVTEPARERTRSGGLARGHDHEAMAGVDVQPETELEHQRWSVKLRSPGAWSVAAGYAVADAKMLRRELVIGYGVAGFLAVLVPSHVWNDVFIHGHGIWTSLENALVGPFIALISFVCSVGNVPLAAALWKGGIRFGGVIAFLFADLITFPLLLIYRQYYGTRLAVRLLVLFWAVMAIAGLVVEGLFALAGLQPHRRAGAVVTSHFAWNYTTWLNFVFLVVAAMLYGLSRNRERFGAADGYASDPVCGMQVDVANAPASLVHEGTRVWFCSERCRDRFTAGLHTATQAARHDGSAASTSSSGG